MCTKQTKMPTKQKTKEKEKPPQALIICKANKSKPVRHFKTKAKLMCSKRILKALWFLN